MLVAPTAPQADNAALLSSREPQDVLPIRERVLRALEYAAMAEDGAERRRRATFVVIGAGRNGVALAGSIAELLRERAAATVGPNPEMGRVLLVEAEIRVLPGFRRSLSAVARDALKRLGVELRLGVAVSEADADGVVLAGKRIPSATMLWALDEDARAEKARFVTISRGMAVGEFGPFAFSGGFAWLLLRVAQLWSGSVRIAAARRGQPSFTPRHPLLQPTAA